VVRLSGVRRSRACRASPDWIKLSGYDKRYATVYLSVIEDPYALALIDSNSDGREIGLIVLVRRREEWLDAFERDDVGDYGSGWCSDLVWAYGRGEPRSTVAIAHREKLHEVSTAEDGWWVFFHPAGPDADGTFTAPERID
jgi:hypothetical protein